MLNKFIQLFVFKFNFELFRKKSNGILHIYGSKVRKPRITCNYWPRRSSCQELHVI